MGMKANAAAAIVAAATMIGGGAYIANAADDTGQTTTTRQSTGRADGQSPDQAVTGAAKDKVIAAVKAKDASATITEVRQDPDGSYDALGTKNSAPVFYDVSKDLKTITANTMAGGHGGPGGPDGQSPDQAVTGAAKDKVIAAVKAKDASATITEVRQDPDGSYDALGTKDGAPVFYDVSKDLKTITANTMAGGHGGPGGQSPDQAGSTTNG